MILLEKGEKADAKYGMTTEYITDEIIESLKKGRRLYVEVFDEYAVLIKYKKEKKES